MIKPKSKLQSLVGPSLNLKCSWLSSKRRTNISKRCKLLPWVSPSPLCLNPLNFLPNSLGQNTSVWTFSTSEQEHPLTTPLLPTLLPQNISHSRCNPTASQGPGQPSQQGTRPPSPLHSSCSCSSSAEHTHICPKGSHKAQPRLVGWVHWSTMASKACVALSTAARSRHWLNTSVLKAGYELQTWLLTPINQLQTSSWLWCDQVQKRFRTQNSVSGI